MVKSMKATAMATAKRAKQQPVVSFVHRYQGDSRNMMKTKAVRAKEVVAPALVQGGAHTCACAI